MGQKCFEKAYLVSNLNTDLIGAKGKRTKYQQVDVAQLILKIQKSNENNKLEFVYSNEQLTAEQLPKVN
jgi:hypothetical protein